MERMEILIKAVKQLDSLNKPYKIVRTDFMNETKTVTVEMDDELKDIILKEI